MGRNQDFTDGGIAGFFEERANGLNVSTMHAPAALAGSYDIELLDALPAGPELLRIDAAGKLTTVSSAAAGSLDSAYDFGGPGAGRVILTTDGPLELAGVDGLRLNTTIPKIEFETDVTDFNYRIAASSAANKLVFQRGNQDADISGDSFVTILSIDELRMVGINTENPQEALHVTVAADIDAKVRVQSPVGRDASIPFFEDGTARFEVGYDDSAGGFAIGLVDFTDHVLFIADGNGAVGIRVLSGVPLAQFHVESAAVLVTVIESAMANARLSLLDTGTSDQNTVAIQSAGDDLQFLAGGSVVMHLDQTDGRVGINETTLLAQFTVHQTVGTIAAVLIDQDQNGEALIIDSEATTAPLVEFRPITGNARGDVFFGTARTADPSSPSESDVWYNSTEDRLKIDIQTAGAKTLASRWAMSFGPEVTVIPSLADEITLGSGNIVIQARTGTADAVDTIITGAFAVDGDVISLQCRSGDTITLLHNVNNIQLDGSSNKAIVNGNVLLLKYNGTDWEQLTTMMVLP